MNRFLVLYWHRDGWMRHAVEHHLRALEHGRAQILYVNGIHPTPGWVRRVEFDAVVLHTTFLCMRWWREEFENFRRRFAWISEMRGTKAAMPQDEYDHSELLDEWLAELGVTEVFTNFPEGDRQTFYPTLASRARFHEVLTGYIDEGAAARAAARMQPTRDRPYDIVYRATKLPYWFGSHGQLKHGLADAVARRAPRHRLEVDISTRFEDTFFGERWLDFLLSGRAVIGCESGSSVLDRRGEIQTRIRSLLDENPDLTFQEVDALMPPGWDSYAFFAISPRHLEAVVTRTCQVLVEGGYSGVLQPHTHYLPLRRDLSNLDDVLEQLRDHALVDEITSRAYEEIYLSRRYTYEAFARRVTPILDGGGARTLRGALSSAQIYAGQRADRGVAAVRSWVHRRPIPRRYGWFGGDGDARTALARPGRLIPHLRLKVLGR